MRDLNYLKTGQLSSVHNIVDYMPKYKKFGSYSKLYNVFSEIFGPHQKQWFNSSYFLKQDPGPLQKLKVVHLWLMIYV